MSLLFGYLTLACFILLAVKYPLRIAEAHKANALLMKLHEAASGAFCCSRLYTFSSPSRL